MAWFSKERNLSETESLEQFYMPWHNHKLSYNNISKGVVYLGHWAGFGPIYPKHALWAWKRSNVNWQNLPASILATRRSLVFQEKCLDATLRDLKDCLILSTTPTYFSQFQNACLLRSRGFKLLEDSCYRHPGYPEPSNYSVEHPGISKDRHWHWEHIWWKLQGPDGPKDIGRPEGLNKPSMNNCGVDAVVGLEQIQQHDSGKIEVASTLSPVERKNYLAVGWLPRGTAFPKGWKRFFSADDYKLGHNFGTLKANVGTCPHNFDLKIFEGWEPDFEKWSPA